MTADDASSLPGWGDLGDGTYSNPILPGDFSDPDVIRVGDEYWMISSTIHMSPGMAILHSTDLITWTRSGTASTTSPTSGRRSQATRRTATAAASTPAACVFHDGLYWMHATTVGEGIFYCTAKHPTGPWSAVRWLSRQKGWDDPCPIWDDDGRAWLVASCPGERWVSYLIPMAADGASIDLDRSVVLDDVSTSEANKTYRIGSYYYLLHNEVRTPGNRVAVIMRARSMLGPWEKRTLLASDAVDREREPCQGALVDDSEGGWWFVTHHGRTGYAEGRPVSVLPVQWRDEWPVVTPDHGDLSITTPRSLPPGLKGDGLTTSDSLRGPSMSPQWAWNHQPPQQSWHQDATGMRLTARRPLVPGDLRTVSPLLTQPLLGAGCQATVRVDLGDMRDGQWSALGLFSRKPSLIGVHQTGDTRRVRTIGAEGCDGPAISTPVVWLRTRVDRRGYASFAFSIDGIIFEPFGNSDPVVMSDYRGSRLFLTTYTERATGGSAVFTDFDYVVDERRGHAL